jgi:hypothetical protein
MVMKSETSDKKTTIQKIKRIKDVVLEHHEKNQDAGKDKLDAETFKKNSFKWNGKP